MNLTDVVDTIFQILPTILLTYISIYFSWQQLFHKVTLSYSICYTGFSAGRISDIMITNKKNKAEILKKIVVVIDEKYTYKVIDFKTPLILNPMECIKVDTEELTEYHLNGQSVDLISMISKYKYYFEIHLDNKILKYHPLKIRKIRTNKRQYIEISTSTKKYNGVVINDTVLYAILYSRNGVHKTAFITKNGIINGDWNFRINGLSPQILNSKELIKQCLSDAEITKHTDVLEVVEVKL